MLKYLPKITQDQATYLAALLHLQEIMDIITLMNLGKKAGTNVIPIDWCKVFIDFILSLVLFEVYHSIVLYKLFHLLLILL